MRLPCRNWTMPSTRSATNFARNTCWLIIRRNGRQTRSFGGFRWESPGLRMRCLTTCDIGPATTRRSLTSEGSLLNGILKGWATRQSAAGSYRPGNDENAGEKFCEDWEGKVSDLEL